LAKHPTQKLNSHQNGKGYFSDQPSLDKQFHSERMFK